MEIISESGLGSYSAGDLSNEVKSETAALGFRVKSGWAAAVLLTGSIELPTLRNSRVIYLSDPRLPETRQPYHAAMGKLETDMKKINKRRDIVQHTTSESIAQLLADCRREDYAVARSSLVVGSQLDPATIGNPHIRAHAFEGQLFQSVLKDVLNANGIHTAILLERGAYDLVSRQLSKSSADVRRALQNLGRSADGPWRAEQKLAALAAWLSLGNTLQNAPIRM